MNFFVNGINLPFPTPIFSLKCENFKETKDDLIALCYEMRDNDDCGVNKSNVGGWQSKVDLIKSNKKFMNIFEDMIFTFFTDKRIFSKNYFEIANIWVNINQKNDYNLPHVHAYSDISGVFYLKVPKNSGDIVFINSQEFQHHLLIDSFTEEFKKQISLYSEYSITPEEGECVIFPSSLYHRVNPNKTNEDRISIAFNIRIKK